MNIKDGKRGKVWKGMIDIAKSTSSKYLLFGSLYFIQGIILAIGQLIIPVYLVEKGFPVPLITLVAGIILIPWSIKFFWGAFIDYYIRFGRKIFVIIGGVQFAAGLFAAACIDPGELLILFVIFLFFSVSGVVLLDVATDAWAIEACLETERGKISGSMFAGQHAGRASGFIFLAFLAHAVSYGFSFVIAAIIILLITGYVFFFQEARVAVPSEKMGASLLHEFKKKTTQYISVFSLIVLISSGILTLAIPLYLKIVFHLDITQMGLMFALFPIVTAVGSLAGGGMADRYGRRIVLFLFISLSVVFSALLIFASGWELLVVLYGMINFLYGGYQTTIFAIFMDVTNPRLGGVQFSILTGIGNTGSTIGETMSGSLVSLLGFDRVFLYAAWFLGPVLVMVYFLRLNAGKKEERMVS